ncbi:30S ribosomal protein S6 modification protein [Vibrio sp. RE86]|uniref:30S ribosomal protein S6 modification protein n=1 Tax=Vibrio sp. RE86 TaxID=2607605 RepID=UPI001493D32D|nr:30S ribosomal protein S6 modification protein [Vibrio sp. RE86]NOH80066.1 30S ribosomal protein S6 modification protein [Vibrio sp. RE86]
MFSQSKILVWYQIASQKVVLGEAVNGEQQDVISRWLQAPKERLSEDCLGYHLSLFDDDGREIADKSVSMLTADEFLSRV